MATIEEIIKGCKRYNKTFQHLLYEKYASIMKSVCFRYLNNASDIEDVLQEGFIKVFMKINQYSGKGSFEGWMKKIFVNVSLKHNLSNQKHKGFLNFDNLKKYENEDQFNFTEEKYDLDLDCRDEDMPKNYYDAISLADLTEKEMLEIIKGLPEKLALVFNLYYIEDFSHDEIAEILSIDIVTSRTRLLRARNFLKKGLYEFCMMKNQ